MGRNTKPSESLGAVSRGAVFSVKHTSESHLPSEEVKSPTFVLNMPNLQSSKLGKFEVYCLHIKNLSLFQSSVFTKSNHQTLQNPSVFIN